MQRIWGESRCSGPSNPPVQLRPRKLRTPAAPCATMSRQPRGGTRVPGPPGSLCALLALLLVALPGPPVNAGPVAVVQLRELRCICLTTSPRVQLKMITNLQVIAAGPQCAKVEIVATLKNRKDPVCLDPQAPRIKKVVETILESKKNKRKNQALGNLHSSEPVSVRSQ